MGDFFPKGGTDMAHPQGGKGMAGNTSRAVV
eukprot:COSAG06_NODE_54447_length_294_cov_1.056410_1_plen_30_part_01